MKKFTSLLLTAFLTVSLTGCGSDSGVQPSGNDIYANDEGYSTGEMHDTVHTYFFDFTINSAYVCETYESYTPAEGNDLLVAEVTIKNTFEDTITMYDTDFQVQWNDEAEDAFDVPITYHMDIDEVLNEDVFPYEYELKKNKSRTGLMIFEVPEGNTEFSISYLEYFEDYTYGDVHFVYFSAEKQ